MKSHRSRSEHVGGSMPIVQSRRRFLTDVALTGAAGLGVAGVAGLGSDRKSLAAEPPPETTKLRLIRTTGHLFRTSMGRREGTAP